ncbi:uncharacterized protein [Miscanthus floridulus]|uniref:uncharacterized protein n=1 Tax=Miscanthus floridulus TaxID=154761 RepID=UPI00345A15AB
MPPPPMLPPRSCAVLPATPNAASPPPQGPVGLPAPSSLRWIGVGRERRKAHRNPRSRRRRAYLVGVTAPLDLRRRHAGVATLGPIHVSVAAPGVVVPGHRTEGLLPPSMARWARWGARRSAVGRGGWAWWVGMVGGGGAGSRGEGWRGGWIRGNPKGREGGGGRERREGAAAGSGEGGREEGAGSRGEGWRPGEEGREAAPTGEGPWGPGGEGKKKGWGREGWGARDGRGGLTGGEVSRREVGESGAAANANPEKQLSSGCKRRGPVRKPA